MCFLLPICFDKRYVGISFFLSQFKLIKYITVRMRVWCFSLHKAAPIIRKLNMTLNIIILILTKQKPSTQYTKEYNNKQRAQPCKLTEDRSKQVLSW